VPDVLVLGKALSGSLPISAAIGTRDAMSGWPPSTGEAIHTSTFLGNPIACAAALAQLDEIESRGLVDRARRLGDRIAATTRGWCRQGLALRSRGRGLLQGVVVTSAAAGSAVTAAALQKGVILLAEGAGDVLAITPPAVITDAQLVYALGVIEAALSDRAGSAGAG
jgi:4-aminobutyrate aminotransferase/(S)-3-amino-2-methylpropionate transaminase